MEDLGKELDKLSLLPDTNVFKRETITMRFTSDAYIPDNANCEEILEVLPQDCFITEWGGGDTTVLEIQCEKDQATEIINSLKNLQKQMLNMQVKTLDGFDFDNPEIKLI